jgi:gliding motility-associated-like protein
MCRSIANAAERSLRILLNSLPIMPKKIFISLALFFLFLITAKAQLGKEAWHWQFGQNCSLDFSTGVPVIGTSAINQWEGTASISDKNTGQLLFYTDGKQIWNKNNIQMPNGFGLLGDNSSTQSALIVPKPGSTTLYYVFTCPANATLGVGVYYSIIDITLNGGLGDVTLKNKQLTAPRVTEKLTAVKNCNNTGYWIIDHSIDDIIGSNAFNAYSLTSAGIDTTPVISNIGKVIGFDPYDDALGYLKASSNGKKLACAFELDSCLQIFDFNNATGIISNPITINYSLTTGPYSIEFSPDNSKLYARVSPTSNLSGTVSQFDLSSNSSSTIINSQTLITYGNKSTLQLGPDGKIYVGDFYSQNIDVINNPNNVGVACNYQTNIITFPLSSKMLLGLPNFINANHVDFTPVNVLKDTVVCTPNNGGNYVANATLDSAMHYTWYDSTQSPIKTFSTSGNYWIDITENSGCTYRDSFNLVFSVKPNINLNDTTLCSPSCLLNAPNNYYNYLWSTGDTTKQITVTNSGHYWVTAANSYGCKNSDSMQVVLNSPPVINILHDTTICSNASVILSENATYPNTLTYNWSDGSNFAIHNISTPGNYWVDYTLNTTCIVRDSFSFTIDSLPYIYLGHDTVLCKPSFILIANIENAYFWNTGSTNQQITVTNSGSYSVIVTNIDGCKNADSINITLYTPPIVDVFKDSAECGNQFSPITLTAYYPNTASYNWSDGFVGQAHTLSSPGNYWVQYTLNNTCISKDSFNLSVNKYPVINLGNDTSFCSSSLNLNALNSSASYVWSGGQTTPSIEVSTAGVYWVQVKQNNCIVSDTLKIIPYHSDYEFAMPNIITPNNDGINDFVDFSTYQFSNIQLEIYNRWGLKVIESNNPNFIWKPSEEDGTYFYTIQYKTDCGNQSKSNILKGFVTIIR